VSFGSRQMEQRFPFAYDTVYDGILAVLPTLEFRPGTEDRAIGRIIASTGASAFSYGEIITIAVRQADDDATLVEIESTLNVPVNFAGSHRNAHNLDEIVSALSAYLQPGSGGEVASPRADALRTKIDAVEDDLQRRDSEGVPAASLFQLGRLYALLFDETRSAVHRESALKYMRRAAEGDPTLAGDDFFSDTESFGSLESDPDFSEFVV